jgi:hypothetical protein
MTLSRWASKQPGTRPDGRTNAVWSVSVKWALAGLGVGGIMAAERTLVAWMRTGLPMLSFGSTSFFCT